MFVVFHCLNGFHWKIWNKIRSKMKTEIGIFLQNIVNEITGCVRVFFYNVSFHLPSDFVPDFPVEAIEAMKDYEHLCYLLCKKKPVFYVIAQQKDFEKRNKRRD